MMTDSDFSESIYVDQKTPKYIFMQFLLSVEFVGMTIFFKIAFFYTEGPRLKQILGIEKTRVVQTSH